MCFEIVGGGEKGRKEKRKRNEDLDLRGREENNRVPRGEPSVSNYA